MVAPRTLSRGNACSPGIGGGVNNGGNTGSSRRNAGGAGGGVVRLHAPGSGLNNGGGAGGALLLTVTERMRFVAGPKAALLGMGMRLGSGSNRVGDSGGVPRMIS